MPFTIIGTGNIVQTFTVPNGSAALPSISFQGAASSGLYHSGNGNVSITSNGTQVITVSPSGLYVDGNVSAPYFIGNGSFLTGVASSNASSLSEGTLDNARLPNSISVHTLSGNLAANFITGTLAETQLPSQISGNGAGLFGLNASNIVGLQAQLQDIHANSVTANFLSGNLAANYITGQISETQLPSQISGNGAGLFGLNASNIIGLQAQLQDLSANSVTANFLSGNLAANFITGTLDNARLPSSISVANVSANGSGLTYLNAANLYGIVPDAALSGDYANVSSLRVYGNLRAGNLILDSGNITTINTAIQVSEQIIVTNEGTGPGIRVRQNYTEPIFEAMDDANVTFKIYDGGYVGIGSGTANLGSSPPTSALLSVVGNVSATSYIGNLDAGYITGILDNSRLPSNITVSGNVSATSYIGNLDASYITGILDNSRLPSTISVSNVNGNGFGLSTLNSANLVGTIENARLPSNISVSGNVSGNYVLGNGYYLQGITTALAGNGFALSNINAANLVGNIEADLNFDIGSVPGNALYGEIDGDLVFTGDIDANVLVGTLSNTLFPATIGTANTTFVGNGSQLTGIVSSPSLSIANVRITDSSYTVSDDLALSTTLGGFVIVNGTGFAPGSMVGFGSDLALATIYVSGTQIRAQAPAKSSGSYNVSVIRGDTATATLPLAVAYSASPVWGTSSVLSNVRQNVAFVTTLSATSDSNVVYSNASTLPPQTTLASNGTFSGNITSVADDTIYTFAIKATDLEFQDTLRTFQLTYLLQFVVTDIVSGSYQSFVIARKQAYAFGYNYHGQLGIVGTARISTNPIPTKGMDGSLTGKSISTLAPAFSGNFTLALATDGTLHSYGSNYYGQLGISTNITFENPNAPTDITTRGSLNGKTVSAIACGPNNAVVLCTDGSVHTFGYNLYGQLGTSVNVGTETPNPTPMNISSNGSLSGKIATKIACGIYYTIVLCSDGTLHSFGLNNYGQLGTTTNSGTSTPNPTPINITSNGTLAGKTVTKIKCGGNFTIVLCSDGSVHGFGQNNSGQLGSTTNVGTNNANPTPFIPGEIASQLTGKTVSEIACGYGHTIVLATDGSLFSFGDNYYGQLGTSTNSGTYNANPNGFIITSNGSLSGKTISKIASGTYHVLILCTDGTLHGFGYNGNGQLGTTTNNNLNTPNPTPTLFTVSE